MNGKSDVLALGAVDRSKSRFAGLKPAGPLMDVWKFFASVKLSIYLLMMLAGTSIIGTLIPQNESPEKYVQAFGENLYRIFDILGVYDMYHAAWFQFLLLMLTANIIVCSVDRLSSTWKIIFVKSPMFNSARFKAANNQKTFDRSEKPESLKKTYAQIVSKQFSYCRTKETESGYFIFAERWRWTRLGVYVVHASVILLLIGAVIGSIFGFDGYANIPEGDSVAIIKSRTPGKVLDLGFSIRCDDFDVSFYETGAPKEFRSSLSILEAGNTVLQKDIIVNDPLRYNGINIFQSSYGQMSPKAVTLAIVSTATGKEYRKEATLGEPIEVPENKGSLVIKGFRNSVQYKGHNIGDAFLGTLTPREGSPIFVLLPLQFPEFDRMRKGAMAISVTNIENRFYTGLQVSTDPGVPLVYSGFALMIIGCFVTFFMSHQRIAVEIENNGDGSRVMVAGMANKNKLGMQGLVAKLAHKLDT